MRARLVLPLLAATVMPVLAGCGERNERPFVVVYASVDQVFAEPVLKEFENRTEIPVRAVYDVEAAKTTGLVNRLLQEQDRPQADVWWSGEFAQTVELADKGVLEPYRSLSASDIPAEYADADGRWTGFGGRARVFLVNTDRLSPAEYPDSIDDLAAPTVPAGQVGMAHPVFGTTATHAAALYAAMGTEPARAFFESIRDAGVKIVDGNSVVRDQVASGQLAFGITDTDDACGALERGSPVALVFPDQQPGGRGTLVIPNTVALVSGAPHPDEGKRLMDYLLSASVEQELVKSGWFQLTLRDAPGGEAAKACVDTSGVKGMAVSLEEVAAQIAAAKADMARVFVR